MKDLKQKTIQGGLARLGAQGLNFALRLGSLMVLGRLLGPKDYGLVGMVTAFTGVLGLFRDFGLSSAAVQRATVTEEQISTLFWINILVGAAARAFDSSDGAGYGGLLPRTPAHSRDRGYRARVSVQRGGGATLGASPTPNAFYHLGGDQHHQFNSGDCTRHCWSQGWLRILGARGYDGYVSACRHNRFLAGCGLGSGNAKKTNGSSFYDAFWRYGHLKRPLGLSCL